ncbi:uncharacterized protein EI90DRAFT_3051862 [Cantharellus anzutake]|uniref:uncharacterized protein n=1 Tax=Cantharellus anzutake TaxID=1750568 RepID=UPI0019087A5A|nr:uncharacterized protein EI90DRAFT_3051862 [Cantharellus anzutake]KAF8334334.1 hypothetical protein EI90DRAFT_3051862 [Cantharellus anzutake]
MGGPLDLWLGPLLLGSTFNTLLLGFVIFQTHQYFTTKHSDRLWVRFLVLYLLGMEVFIVALEIYLVWNYCVTNFGNVAAFHATTWSYNLVPTVVALVSLPVQLFFARRVWILTKRLWFAAFIAMCSALILLCSIGITVSNTVIENFTYRYPVGTKVLSTVGLSLHILDDIMITGSMIFYLHSHRTGLTRSDALITDMIRLTVQTGTATIVIVTALFILVEINSFRFISDNASAIFYLPLSKFYSLSLLVNLNARQSWNFPDAMAWDSNQFGSMPRPGDGIIATRISLPHLSSKQMPAPLQTSQVSRSYDADSLTVSNS